MFLARRACCRGWVPRSPRAALPKQRCRGASSSSGRGSDGEDAPEHLEFATLAAKPWWIHPGATDALALPIVPAATYRLRDAQHGARLAEKRDGPQNDGDGYFYSRWGAPTTQVVASQLAALEGAKAGSLLFASGMAAISAALLARLGSGDHVVMPQALYGGTHELVQTFLLGLGIEVSFVDSCDIAEYEAALRPNTRVLYAESPSNPTIRLTDLQRLGALSRERGFCCMVDGTFASPALVRLLAIDGVDVSIHAGTKYLGGHSDLTAGVVSSHDEDFMHRCAKAQKLFGGTLSAFDSFLLHRGIKTLDVRMERHGRNALAVAVALEAHPGVSRVFYPGLPSHPDHELAKRQFAAGGGFGGMMAFIVKGGLRPAQRLVESLRTVNLAVSLGGVESLAEHPASMTHAMVPPEERAAAGIDDGLVRLSVGLEDSRDLIADLDRGLKAAEA